MTDSHDPTGQSRPLDPLDELVSSILDGDATPKDVAAVAADPQATALLDAMRLVHDAVAEPVETLDQRHRDASVAAALAAFDTTALSEGTTVANEAADDEVATHRARRRGSVPAWLTSAAAVVLVIVIGAAALRTRSSNVDTAAQKFESVASAISDEQPSAEQKSAPLAGRRTAESDATQDTATSTTAARRPAALPETGPAPNATSATIDFGYVSSSQELQAAVSARMGRTTAAGAGGGAGAPAPTAAAPVTTIPATTTTVLTSAAATPIGSCEATARGVDTTLGAVVLTGSVVYGSVPATVIAFAAPATGSTRVLVFDASCRVLAAVTVA